MRTASVLLIPIAIALLVTAFPASAKYSEQWMTNSEITHAQSSTATARSDNSARKAPLRAAATTADDDPIAAFAHDQKSQHKAPRH